MNREELYSILKQLKFQSNLKQLKFQSNGVGYDEWTYIQGFHFFLKVKIEDGYVDFYFNHTNLFGSMKLEDMTVCSLFEFLDRSELPIPRNTESYKRLKKELIRDYNITQIIS